MASDQQTCAAGTQQYFAMVTLSEWDRFPAADNINPISHFAKTQLAPLLPQTAEHMWTPQRAADCVVLMARFLDQPARDGFVAAAADKLRRLVLGADGRQPASRASVPEPHALRVLVPKWMGVYDGR